VTKTQSAGPISCLEHSITRVLHCSIVTRAAVLCSDLAFLCMTNKTQILSILWYEFVTNVEVASLSQVPSINEAISRRRHSLFGHVRCMDQTAPAHQALHLSVTSRQGSGQFDTWRRQPGRLRKCWVEQVTTSTGLSPSEAWSVATDRSAWRALRPVDGQA